MTLKKKRLVLNIVFYLVLALIYGLVIFALVIKFNNGAIYMFSNRVDVVLTDSMSVRNENHKEYLEGTTQIQPFDMVVSKEIKDDTVIEEKDCVLFNNPKLNNKLVVHRVVHIYEEGTYLKINNGESKSFNNETVFSLDTLEGKVTMETLDYSSISITAYSSSIHKYYYVIFEGKNEVETTCETTKVADGIYKHIITYNRASTSPFKTFISAGTDDEVYISSISYVSMSQGTLTLNASDVKFDDGYNFKTVFNAYYLYEIRADKSSTSDGIFERSELKAKVTNVIPKLGHVVHFLQSLPGILMLIGLTVLIVVASFFWNKDPKPKTPIEETPTEVVKEETPKIESKEESKPKKAKKQE